ncbi:MAG: hypothetical protein M3044_11180 [Thermoproteota archaeon]|nr:hypothetical protein [Thermoproteota archaeon]
MVRHRQQTTNLHAQVDCSANPDDPSCQGSGGSTSTPPNDTLCKLSEKVVRAQVSSYQNLNEKIIGQKGMGKLSFLALSSENKVEFYSHSEEVGLKVLMTMEGFKHRFINNIDALPHHGLKIVIKRAKRPMVSDTRLIEYLSKVFAIRIARGLKLYVNNILVCKPHGFDSKQYELFRLQDGTAVFGNLKHIEKPPLDKIDIFVKNVFVVDKNFDNKVEGWVNCNQLELETSRDGLLEDNDVHSDFMKQLMQHLDREFEKKSELKQREPRSKKQIAKLFVDVMKSINDLYPEMTKPIVTGFRSNEAEGMGGRSESGAIEGPCTLQEGKRDPNGELMTAKPIGPGKSHQGGPGESTCRVTRGGTEKKILAPSYLHRTGNDLLPK